MTDITVTRSPGVIAVAAAVMFVGLAGWGTHNAMDTIGGWSHQFGTLFACAFGLLCTQTALYHLELPWRVTPRKERHLDKLNVVISVPVYNEDPALLLHGLLSMVTQSRKPNLIFVVDDGSSKAQYADVQREFEEQARAAGVLTRWARIPNAGKRQAQGIVVRNTPDADIYLTVDSDTYLDHEAVREVLKPFRHEDVQSVAAMILPSNNRQNLLTRVIDLWYVTVQLVSRSSAAALGSVLVNSGNLAAYRAAVIRDNLDSYLAETFFGRRVEFSDDSLLTLYALNRGRTVTQPTAFALTAMPENVSHHVRQYLRWMRGSTIRSWWRFKYLPLNRPAFWLHLGAWAQMVLSTVLFVLLFVVAPAVVGRLSPLLILVPFCIVAAQSMRYLSIRRSDQSVWSQLGTVALFPIMMVWVFFGLRPLRWYGIATCWKTGSWGTRQTVEVRADTARPAPVELAV